LDNSISKMLLTDYNDALKSELIKIFLISVAVAFQNIFEDYPVHLVYNKRYRIESWNNQLGIYNTISWFTTITPVDLTSDSINLVHVLRHSKDTWRSFPTNGPPEEFTSKIRSDAVAKRFGQTIPAELIVNYFGQLNTL
jgi:hypothetical protein